MLTELLQSGSMSHFPVGKEICIRFCIRQGHACRTYFGHGVTFDIRSSTANDMPRTKRQLPSPFHSVVIPCRWCKWIMTGSKVKGTRCFRDELWCTWHCRLNTTNGWLSRFSVIKLTRPTLTPKYFRTDTSSSSGLSYTCCAFRRFCNGSVRSRVEFTYL